MTEARRGDDHYGVLVKEIAISEFKAKCLAVVERVGKTKTPIRITRVGKPVAELVPVPSVQERSAWIGSMKDSVEILGDIISPANDEGQ